MPTFYDSQNNAITLGERLGSGGEGTVYSCEDADTVGKIYHEPITDEKAEKLRWMAANKNEQLLKTAAWVADVLQDAPNGRVVGFTMARIKAKEIHELYSLKSRRVYFPEATWQFLVHTATNVARAFYNLHRNSHVMGDVNHGNCVVSADGTVKLIDCDSYSIKIGETRHRCEVGVATHLAPELQGADLSEIEREEKHDNFGLAVIIFQLLFLGRHPFAGNYLGEEDKSIEECIRELRFAYGDGAKDRKVKQPPGTLALASVSPRIALMLERAFLTEHRPEPREWIEALADLSENLAQCGLHPGHFYFNGLARCPWCEIESQTGLMLFPFVTAGKNADGEKPFNVFTVESLIASFGISENLPAKPLLPAVLPPPAPEIIEARRSNKKQLIVSASVQFFGLIFLVAVFGAGIAFFIGMASMMFWLIYWKGSSDFQRDDVVREFSGAQAEWDSFEEKWRLNPLPPSLENDLTKIRTRIGDYQKFQQENVREAKNLQDELVRRELFQHLRSMSLEDAEIEDFDEQERQWLIGKGIKTAAEITENRIRLFNDFDGEIVPKLLEWRNKIELEFVSAPRSADFVNEQEEFVKETARERRRIEMDIEHSLNILRSGAVNLRRRQQELGEKLENTGKRLMQARSNSEALGSNSPAVVVLVLITILTPYFGFIVGQINTPKAVDDYSSGRKTSRSGSGTSTFEDSSYVPDETITDQEISMMPDNLRTKYAERLLMKTAQMSYDKPDYERDERQMRLAVRLRKDDTRFINQLGFALFNQKKYDESLKVLNDSLKIEKENSTTKIYIANNYQQLKRFADAKKILTEVVEQYPQYEGFYNLGLANKGLKSYKAAVEAFQKAAKINPNDANVNYELGLAYHQVGDKTAVQQQYEKLLGIDESKAHQLAKETNLRIGIATRIY